MCAGRPFLKTKQNKNLEILFGRNGRKLITKNYRKTKTFCLMDNRNRIMSRKQENIQ